MLLLAASYTNENGQVSDEIKAFDSLDLASKDYKKALDNENLFSASICVVLQSTDYEGVCNNSIIAAKAVLKMAGYKIKKKKAKAKK